MSANVTCTICGEQYKICNTCLEQKTFKPWRTVTDTIEHYKIYMALHNYTVSKDKEQARQELERCDLTGFDGFNPDIKAAINEIMAEPKKAKEIDDGISK